MTDVLMLQGIEKSRKNDELIFVFDECSPRNLH